MSDMMPEKEEIDYEKICQVLEEKMQPVFDLIAQRFQEHEEVIGKIVGGMHDAVTSYKRGALQESVTGKYGPELGPLDEYSKDNFGHSFSDELLDALMGDDAPGPDKQDEFIRGRIDGFKGKFGKWLGGPPKVEATVVEAKTPEGEAEKAPEPEKPAEPEAKQEEKKEPEPEERGQSFPGHNGGIIPDMVKALGGKGPKK